MTNGLNNLQSAVLSGTGQQIDQATSKIKAWAFVSTQNDL